MYLLKKDFNHFIYKANTSYCYRGKNCPFAHSKDELRKKKNLEKTKLCPYYLTN